MREHDWSDRMGMFLGSWKGKTVLATLLLVVLLGFAAYFFLIRSLPPAVGGKVTLLVPVGLGVREIGEECQELGIIRSAAKFAFLAKVTGMDRKLRAGRYVFSRGDSELKVLEVLAKGEWVGERVVIPEGVTAQEIARTVEEKVGIEEKQFLSLVRDQRLCRELGVESDNLEGYLYPDSYGFNWGMEPEGAIGIMVGRFFEVFEGGERRASELGLSTHQIVTLASMIEKEAKLDEERPLIAAVYHSRLEKGLLLQCDATVLYALPKHKERLLYRDLNVDSPYNTYLHKGLPPGPICNPGKSSILAALYPAEVDYLYYVARGDGSHIFSRTKKEHQRARRQARRYQKERGS